LFTAGHSQDGGAVASSDLLAGNTAAESVTSATSAARQAEASGQVINAVNIMQR